MKSTILTPAHNQNPQTKLGSQLAKVAADTPQTDQETKTSVTPVNDNRSPYIPPGKLGQKLQHTLEHHQGERQIVVIQDFPDPDALSSAWAYQLIAQTYDIHCDIIYAGTLSHQENIALVKLTGLPAKRWSINTLKERDLSVYQSCVLVDSQGNTSQLMPLVKQAKIPIVVVIDHHSKQGDIRAEFIDLRPQIRATATIITQYLQAGLLDFNSSNNVHVKCATALMHGIRSDTNNLLQAQEADLLAAAYLSRIYDSQLLNAVLQSAR